MKNEIKHTTHSTYRCQYHIVFAPKYRRKAIYGQILRKLCEQKGVEIIEATAIGKQKLCLYQFVGKKCAVLHARCYSAFFDRDKHDTASDSQFFKIKLQSLFAEHIRHFIIEGCFLYLLLQIIRILFFAQYQQSRCYGAHHIDKHDRDPEAARPVINDSKITEDLYRGVQRQQKHRHFSALHIKTLPSYRLHIRPHPASGAFVLIIHCRAEQYILSQNHHI